MMPDTVVCARLDHRVCACPSGRHEYWAVDLGHVWSARPPATVPAVAGVFRICGKV